MERTSFFKHTFFFIVLFGVFFVGSGTLFAATLSINPDHGSFGPGDTFLLTVRVDTEEHECINAGRIEITYPREWVKASTVSTGESLFTLWTQEPTIDSEQGLVVFEGGIPGGYCGRIQGDPGETNTLARIVMSIPGNMVGGEQATGPVPLDVGFGPGTQVFFNDGFGTPAPLSFRTGKFKRVLESQGTKNEWLELVREDTVAPDPFPVTVLHDQEIFGGKHFIIFSTVDKQSGIDHFEVMEDDPVRFGFVRGKTERSSFVAAKSPYLLADQERKSRIVVRAFDHAGNMTETIVPPEGAAESAGSSQASTSLWWIGSFGAILMIMAGVSFELRRRKKTDMVFDHQEEFHRENELP